MIYEHLFRREKKKRVRAALIGTGSYGVSLLAQAQRTPRLDLAIVCDIDLDAARQACADAGIDEDRLEMCATAEVAERAIHEGRIALVEDATVAIDIPSDVIVECTGKPEAAAQHAVWALEARRHVAMVSKEADCIVGPLLARKASEAGLVYTPVDGDQHGILAGLEMWARTLGFEVLTGGKARESDFVYDEKEGTVACRRRSVTLDEGSRSVLRPIAAGEDIERRVEERREALAGLPFIMPADICEMAIAANHTGLLPDREELWTPVLRTTEAAQVLCPQSEGGLMTQEGVIDVFGCLRRQDESGQMGGEFIVVRCDNEASRDFLGHKGLIMNERRTAAFIYRPLHLLGVETPISILCAGLLGIPTGMADVRPVADLIGRARVDISAGTILEPSVIHTGELLQPLMRESAPLSADAPIPLYMAQGRSVSHDVSKGSILRVADVTAPDQSVLWDLRREQDGMFTAHSHGGDK